MNNTNKEDEKELLEEILNQGDDDSEDESKEVDPAIAKNIIEESISNPLMKQESNQEALNKEYISRKSVIKEKPPQFKPDDLLENILKEPEELEDESSPKITDNRIIDEILHGKEEYVEPEVTKDVKENDGFNMTPIQFVDNNENIFRFLTNLEPRNSISDIKYTKSDIKNIARGNYQKLATLQEIYNGYQLQFHLKASPSAIAFKNGKIFIGNSKGVIRIFEYLNDFPERIPPIKDSETQEIPVTCIDFAIVADRYLLVAGFQNGIILIYDLKTYSIISKILKVHKKAIIHIKILLNCKYLIVSSDVEGNTYFLEESKNFFGFYSYDATSIDEKRILTCLSMYEPNSIFSTNLNSKSLLAIGDSSLIIIMNLFPVPKVKKRIHKWNTDNESNSIAAWGFGAIPGNLENENPLLAICWGKVIQLIQISLNDKGEELFLFSGYFICHNLIDSIHWITNGTLFVYHHFIKEAILLYTGNFLEGKYPGLNDTTSLIEKTNQIYLNIPNRENSPEIALHLNIIEELIYTTFKVNSDSDSEKSIGLLANTMVSNGNNILFIAKESTGQYCIYRYYLYQWNEYLKELKDQGNWIESMSYLLDIFKGNIKGFSGIHENNTLREQLILPEIKDFFGEFMRRKMQNFINNAKEIQKEFLHVIEFALEIKASDLLFEEIAQKFEKANKEEYFFKSLETLFYDSKLSDIEIDDKSLKKIVLFYEKREEIEILENIFLSLSFENNDKEYISEICWNNHMISALIYIKTFNISENEIYLFLDPLSKLMDIFRKNKEIKIEEKKLYDLKFKELIEKNQYNGYKIFWYLNLCLNGVTYPSKKGKNEKLNRKIYSNVVYLIIHWLLIKENFLELLKFDLFLIFEILTFIVESPIISEFIINQSKYNFDHSVVLSYDIIISEIINNCTKEFDPKYSQVHLSLFIARISSLSYIKIPFDNSLRALMEILSCKDDLIKIHFPRVYYSSEELENYLLNLINGSNLALIRNNLNVLITSAQESHYFEVKSLLYQLANEYFKCFECYLQSTNIITKKKVFEWIYLNHYKIDPANLLEIKQSIMKNLQTLFQIDVAGFVKIIDTIFENGHQSVLDALVQDPKLQLNYLEHVLLLKGEIIKKVMIGEEMSEDDTKLQEFSELLISHTRLLCKIKKDDLLMAFKKYKFYPIKTCIEICKESNAYEGLAYLYYKDNQLVLSLDVYILLMKKIIDEQEKSNEKRYRKNFKKYFRSAMKVCKKDSLIHKSEEKEKLLWYELFNRIYDIWLTSFNKSKNQEKGAQIEIIPSKVINECVRQLLEEMSKSVGMQEIVQNISEKHGELEFEGLKGIFSSMLNSLFAQEKIFFYAKMIITRAYKNDLKDLIKFRLKSIVFEKCICHLCNGNIELSEKTRIIMFKCYHTFHIRCYASSGIKGCFICQEREEIQKILDTEEINENKNEKNPKKIEDSDDEIDEKESNPIANNSNKDEYGVLEVNDKLRKLKINEKFQQRSFAFIRKDNESINNMPSLN